MTTEEKIQLLELLREYQLELQRDIDKLKFPPPETVDKYRALIVMQEHSNCIDEICECISFDL